MKEKIKNWLKVQTKESKIIFLFSFALHLILAIYTTVSKFLYVLEYGLGAFLGRLFGLFLGTVIPVIIISGVIALFPYFIFRNVAAKYKRYFDYFSFIFLIITLIIGYGIYYRWRIFGF